jgi:hypothetical protein
VGALHHTFATLRFFGDDLDPDEVTAKLGGKPTAAFRKGGVRALASGGAEVIAREGGWLFEAAKREPGDLDAQVRELLDPLTADLAVWRDLVGRYQADISCGLYMAASHDGDELRPGTLAAIGARGLKLSLDIYGPEGD